MTKEPLTVLLPADVKQAYQELCRQEGTNPSVDVRAYIISRTKKAGSHAD